MERHPLRRSSLAAEVRAELARQEKSYASLSRATGIKIDTLYSRLNGKKPFQVEELDAIAFALNVPLATLHDRATTGAQNV